MKELLLLAAFSEETVETFFDVGGLTGGLDCFGDFCLLGKLEWFMRVISVC